MYEVGRKERLMEKLVVIALNELLKQVKDINKKLDDLTSSITSYHISVQDDPEHRHKREQIE